MSETLNFLDTAAGVQSDCDRLLKRFIDANNIRYEEFSKIWKDMKMSFIFYGKEYERELIEFTDEALNIAKTYWLHRSDYQTQIGGLYLLYGFYMKQPNRIKRKIRVTTDEWILCGNFVDYIVESSHWDTLYVFRQLVAMNAFRYVLLSIEMHPDSLAKPKIPSKGHPDLELDSQLSSYFDEIDLQDLASCHDKYFMVKSDIMKKHNNVSLTDKDAIVKIMRTVNSLAVVNSGNAENPNPAEENSSDTSSEEEFDDDNNIGTRRAQLKKKMFSTALQFGHHLRHTGAEMVHQFENDAAKSKNSDRGGAWKNRFGVAPSRPGGNQPRHRTRVKYTSDSDGLSSDERDGHEPTTDADDADDTADSEEADLVIDEGDQQLVLPGKAKSKQRQRPPGLSDEERAGPSTSSVDRTETIDSDVSDESSDQRHASVQSDQEQGSSLKRRRPKKIGRRFKISSTSAGRQPKSSKAASRGKTVSLSKSPDATSLSAVKSKSSSTVAPSGDETPNRSSENVISAPGKVSGDATASVRTGKKRPAKSSTLSGKSGKTVSGKPAVSKSDEPISDSTMLIKKRKM